MELYSQAFLLGVLVAWLIWSTVSIFAWKQAKAEGGAK